MNECPVAEKVVDKLDNSVHGCALYMVKWAEPDSEVLVPVEESARGRTRAGERV